MHTEYLEVNTPILKGLQFSIIKITHKTTNQPPNGTCPRIFCEMWENLTSKYLLNLTQLPPVQNTLVKILQLMVSKGQMAQKITPKTPNSPGRI